MPRTGALLVSVLVLALAVPPGFGIAAQTEPPPARTPRDTAPEWMLYRTLFHTIHLLNAQAAIAGADRLAAETGSRGAGILRPFAKSLWAVGLGAVCAADSGADGAPPRPDRTPAPGNVAEPPPSLPHPVTQPPAESVIAGTTLISYDDDTGLVTAIATTELDYAPQEWYVERVACRILDANGVTLASQSADDTDGDGTVSVIVQMPGQVGVTYSVEGRCKLWLDIQNPISGCYLDYWNFPLGFLGRNHWVLPVFSKTL